MADVKFKQIQFYLNNQFIEAAVPPDLTALSFIRDYQHLPGTKEGCSEGDCGACTVALGGWEGDAFIYRAVTACIMPATKLHDMHVITIEGLGSPDHLHLIQQKLLEHHGTQCGYCTPGVIMSLFCLLSRYAQPSEEQLLLALEGNLCRCTGYRSIFEGAHAVIKTVSEHSTDWQSLIIPDYVADIQKKLKSDIAKMSDVNVEKPDHTVTVRSYEMPKNSSELLDFMKRYSGQYKFIAGGTDLIVAANVENEYSPYFIDVTEVEEFKAIQEKDNRVMIGCAVTYSQLIESEIVQKLVPVMPQAFVQMASTQIRNMATLVGNVANGSSLGDGVCVLMALGAELVLLSAAGQRKVPLSKFYQGYRKFDLKENEMVAFIEVPIQQGICHFEKTSKRKALDISSLSSCINLQVNDAKEVTDCRVVFGGFGPCTLLAEKCMTFLLGKQLNEDIVEPLAAVATDEFTFRDNVRASAAYRKQLIGNHVRKQFKKFLAQ